MLLSLLLNLQAGKRFFPERRFLITVDGARYLVPESELHRWIDDKKDELDREAKKQHWHLVRNSPKIEIKSDSLELKVDAEKANLEIRSYFESMANKRKRRRDEDDIESILLVI